MAIPYIDTIHDQKILMVDDKPFILLAGEVHNSSSSSAEYMEKVWEKATELGMNTLLLPVSWELIEPEEGNFQFELVDKLIEQGRSYGKKIVFLWFGSWKNAQCYYAPAWVKTDLKRFQRAQIEKGKNFTKTKEFYDMPYTSISYFCENAMQADARAFSKLMAHIREVDEEQNTVIMVQVENETGILGAAREHSDFADEMFAKEVPQELVDYLNKHWGELPDRMKAAMESGSQPGDWETVFSSYAEEAFSAYYIAKYVNTVAEAGKREYPLPMAVNCWLEQGGTPGRYPSGGPIAKIADIWKFAAPAIDIIAPDIYVRNFCETCDEYTRENEPLFIPETACHSYAAPREIYTVGHYHTMCYSPFGFEDMGDVRLFEQGYLFGADSTDPLLQTPQNVEEYGWITRMLHEMIPLLAEKYGTRDLQAVICERAEEDEMLFGDYGFKVVLSSPMISRKDGVCLVLKAAEDEFYMLGNGCAFTVFSTNQETPNVDILVMEDGEFTDGHWKANRRLNGDEVVLMHFDKPGLLHMKLFQYE